MGRGTLGGPGGNNLQMFVLVSRDFLVPLMPQEGRTQLHGQRNISPPKRCIFLSIAFFKIMKVKGLFQTFLTWGRPP